MSNVRKLQTLEYQRGYADAKKIYERKGKWEKTDAYPHRIFCSECYKTYLRNEDWVEQLGVPMNYCPNCGAEMRERKEE